MPRTPAPELPAGIPWPRETLNWWTTLGNRPRTPDEWEFCLETALVHADVWGGNTARTRELRQRLDRIARQSLPTPNGWAWTGAETRKLKDLHAQGLSLHAIAKEMGRTKSTISRHGKMLGLDWDRSATAAATKAVQIDGRARRAAIVARMYDRIEHLQDRLEAPTFQTVMRGIEGDQPQDLSFVPAADEQRLADTVARYATAATRIEAADATGADTTRGLLMAMAARIGIDDTAAASEPTGPE